jgi:menaquinone-dependent protoporphyrinogen oxidase
VFYATREGHTRKIAEYLASDLCACGVDSVAVNIDSPEARTIDWSSVRGAVLGASIHIGKHEKEAVAFAREHRAQLNERPSAFFSVSLSAGSSNSAEVKAAEALAQTFVEDTGWYADRVVCLAGCLAYTKYGFVKRLILRQIAKKEGASTDTSRDHEYTDWTKVHELAGTMAAAVKAGKAAQRRGVTASAVA